MDDVRSELAKLFAFQKNVRQRGIILSEFSQKDASSSVEARQKGNQLYTQKDNHNGDIHRDILFQYSKSIALAPTDSEELALAYSNRSILMLHLQRFEGCLIDIEKSMQISKSDALKAKLETRKEKCLALMKNSNHNNQVSKKKVASKQNKAGSKSAPLKQVNQVGFCKIISSSQMPVASEAVIAAYSETLGRHLVASRNIKAGEVIIVEKGYICLPKHSQMYLVCTHCLKFAWNGIPCDDCAFGLYCNEECKKEAWDEYHEVECVLLPFMSSVLYEEEGLMNSLIIAVRMLIKAIKKEGLDTVLNEAKVDKIDLEGMTVNGILHHDKFRTFYNLLSHEKSIRKLVHRMNLNESEIIQSMLKHTSIFDAAKHSSEGTIEPEVLLQLDRILGKLIDIIKVNAFGYHGHNCQCTLYGNDSCKCDSYKGMIFASCASLINHSCAPNVCRMNLPKGKIVFFTYTPVKKGEQLCDSYGPTAGMPKKCRYDSLEKHFFFTCRCRCCEENWFSDGPEAFAVTHKADESTKMKIMDEFERSFPCGLDSSLFTDEMNDWKFDEEQLKMALKMTDLTYKHYKNPMACFACSIHFRIYIDLAFNKLFGENAIIPENCLSI